MAYYPGHPADALADELAFALGTALLGDELMGLLSHSTTMLPSPTPKHKGQRRHRCSDCGITFKKWKLCLEHLLVAGHTGSQKVRAANGTALPSPTPQSHKYRCICGMTFKMWGKCRDHLQTSGHPGSQQRCAIPARFKGGGWCMSDESCPREQKETEECPREQKETEKEANYLKIIRKTARKMRATARACACGEPVALNCSTRACKTCCRGPCPRHGLLHALPATQAACPPAKVGASINGSHCGDPWDPNSDDVQLKRVETQDEALTRREHEAKLGGTFIDLTLAEDDDSLVDLTEDDSVIAPTGSEDDSDGGAGCARLVPSGPRRVIDSDRDSDSECGDDADADVEEDGGGDDDADRAGVGLAGLWPSVFLASKTQHHGVRPDVALGAATPAKDANLSRRRRNQESTSKIEVAKANIMVWGRDLKTTKEARSYISKVSQEAGTTVVSVKRVNQPNGFRRYDVYLDPRATCTAISKVYRALRRVLSLQGGRARRPQNYNERKRPQKNKRGKRGKKHFQAPKPDAKRNHHNTVTPGDRG